MEQQCQHMINTCTSWTTEIAILPYLLARDSSKGTCLLLYVQVTLKSWQARIDDFNSDNTTATPKLVPLLLGWRLAMYISEDFIATLVGLGPPIPLHGETVYSMISLFGFEKKRGSLCSEAALGLMGVAGLLCKSLFVLVGTHRHTENLGLDLFISWPSRPCDINIGKNSNWCDGRNLTLVRLLLSFFGEAISSAI
ncbi:unnamed protein product [Absidia cylindrospora]